MTKRSVAQLLLAGALLSGICLAQAEEADPLSEIAGVIGLTPVEEHTCIAAYVPLGKGQALAGVRWYNNDGAAVFPRVLLSAGDANGPAPLESAAVSVSEVEGASLGWSELAFQAPVASPAAGLYVIFEFPAYQERSSIGAGGGPGIGYRASTVGCPGWLSRDGQDWVKMHAAYRLALEPVLVGQEDAVKSLGGRDKPLDQEPQVQATVLKPAQPNPFNPITRLEFALRISGPVKLSIYNIRGELVRRLVDESYEAGVHVVEWRGDDLQGQSCPSGMYFARFLADGVMMTQQLTLVK